MWRTSEYGPEPTLSLITLMSVFQGIATSPCSTAEVRS
jgi:hypothetical protein